MAVTRVEDPNDDVTFNGNAEVRAAASVCPASRNGLEEERWADGAPLY